MDDIKLQIRATSNVDPNTLQAIERIHRLWNEALERKDAAAAAALYAPDTVLESPLVRHILKSEQGIVQTREKLHEFIKQVFARTPASRHIYRTGFFTDGKTVMWEYPRATPQGEQMDFVEVMEIEDALIKRHRVYWGWLGVRIMEEDRYWR
jgi:ketosteroid isomerase-like protein